MNLIIEKDGQVRVVYGEEIVLDALGSLKIERAGHVEADDSGRWSADLSAVRGPILGPFHKRSEALEAEAAWLEENWPTDESSAFRRDVSVGDARRKGEVP